MAHIKEFDNRAVGTVVRKLRKQKKLSQEVVSALAGIARSHLSMIETGVKQANFETLWKLAYALEIRPHELVKLIEDEAEKTSSDN
ncbi:MAG: helix-turn-helix transcriptional regulator [Clostridia bacterium]|nr:helix-turn-helix transcriptional regulator [Clostridia bacterium]